MPFSYEAAVFDNRFPSFRRDPPAAPLLDGPTGPAQGRCEVVLYTDRHDASFGELSPDELARVVAIWIDRGRDLWADPAHAYVCVFENRGAEVGATIAHPHGQIYALDHVPPVTAAKAEAHRRHRRREGGCLSCEATHADDRSGRVVSANETFVVAVPFAARWPFEVAVRARRHGLRRLADLVPEEQRDLALALRDVARRYDALFDFPLPYMMVAQEAPHDEPDWHLAFELYPVHRAPGVTKIRASVETGLGLFLNDVSTGGRGAAARRPRSSRGADRARFALRGHPTGCGDALVSAEARELHVPASLRRERMLAEIKEREFVRVGELSSRFGVSDVTVRGDLDSLAARGKVHRVRGGAIPRLIPRQEQPFEDSISSFAAEKVAIAQAAAALLEDGETVLLDVGTTAAAAARAIAARAELSDVVVFTNGLKTALELESAIPQITVVVLGGTLRPLQHSLVDPLATLILDQISVKTVLLGCNGIDPIGGVTNINLPEAALKQRMLAVATRRVVLADGSKLGRVEVARLCDVADIDLVITGPSADPAVVEALRERDCEVHVAR